MATPVSVRLPDDLRERVRLLAADDRRSLGSMVIVLLEEAIAKRGSERAGGVGLAAATSDASLVSGDLVRAPADLSTKNTFKPDPK